VTVSLDPFVDDMARDESRSLIERVEFLADFAELTQNEADRLNAQSWIESLTLQRMAREST
jgi:hypothetical protein